MVFGEQPAEIPLDTLNLISESWSTVDKYHKAIAELVRGWDDPFSHAALVRRCWHIRRANVRTNQDIRRRRLERGETPAKAAICSASERLPFAELNDDDGIHLTLWDLRNSRSKVYGRHFRIGLAYRSFFEGPRDTIFVAKKNDIGEPSVTYDAPERFAPALINDHEENERLSVAGQGLTLIWLLSCPDAHKRPWISDLTQEFAGWGWASAKLDWTKLVRTEEQESDDAPTECGRIEAREMILYPRLEGEIARTAIGQFIRQAVDVIEKAWGDSMLREAAVFSRQRQEPASNPRVTNWTRPEYLGNVAKLLGMDKRTLKNDARIAMEQINPPNGRLYRFDFEAIETLNPDAANRLNPDTSAPSAIK